MDVLCRFPSKLAPLRHECACVNRLALINDVIHNFSRKHARKEATIIIDSLIRMAGTRRLHAMEPEEELGITHVCFQGSYDIIRYLSIYPFTFIWRPGTISDSRDRLIKCYKQFCAVVYTICHIVM